MNAYASGNVASAMRRLRYAMEYLDESRGNAFVGLPVVMEREVGAALKDLEGALALEAMTEESHDNE